MNIPREYLVALQEAQNRLKRGDGKGAIHIGAQLLRVMPKHPGIHMLMGRAFALEGDTDQSLARFRAASELVPKDAGVWTEFVTGLLKAGQKGRARKVAQKAPLKGPEKKILLDLAKGGEAPSSGPSAGGAPLEDIRRLQALMQGGKPEEVRHAAADLLKTYPESAAILNLAGTAALALEDFAAAEAFFVETCKLSPRYAGGFVNLGLSRVKQRKFREAIASFQDALKLEPKSVDAQKNLVLASAEAHEHLFAIDHAMAFLADEKDDADVLKAYATVLGKVRHFDEAFDVIDRLEALIGETLETRRLRLTMMIDADQVEEAQSFAKQHLERHPELVIELARLRGQLGDLDGARADLRKWLEENPHDMRALTIYGSFAKWTEDDPVLPRLREVVARVTPGSEDETSAFYALAKAHLELGEDEAVFPALHRANASQRLTYDFEGEERLRVDIQTRWTREAIDRLAALGDPDFAPIFIVGTPRSGSTLIDHVIAAHPSVSSVGEDSLVAPLVPLSITADRKVIGVAAERCLEACQKAVPDGARLLDKMLHNYQRLGALAAVFPQARFVQTSRDPRAAALSIYRNVFRGGQGGHAYAANLEDIGRYYTQYIRYMQHWKDVVGDRVVTCRYEDVVSDPEPEIRTLLGKLELEWDEACLRPEAVQKRVKTLSVAQVRSGINTASSELWRRFEAELAPFTEIVSEVWDFEAGCPTV